MAAKVAVALRLAPDVLARVDAYAAGRGVSRQVVLETATTSFLDDAQGGVPDLRPEPRAAERPAETPAPFYGTQGRQGRVNAMIDAARAKAARS